MATTSSSIAISGYTMSTNICCWWAGESSIIHAWSESKASSLLPSRGRTYKGGRDSEVPETPPSTPIHPELYTSRTEQILVAGLQLPVTDCTYASGWSRYQLDHHLETHPSSPYTPYHPHSTHDCPRRNLVLPVAPMRWQSRCSTTQTKTSGKATVLAKMCITGITDFLRYVTSR